VMVIGAVETVEPLAMLPMIAGTFFATRSAATSGTRCRSEWSSSLTSTRSLPSTPPAALISSIAICTARSSSSPIVESAPVCDRRPPSVMVLLGVPPHAAIAKTRANPRSRFMFRLLLQPLNDGQKAGYAGRRHVDAPEARLGPDPVAEIRDPQRQA